MGAMSFVTVGLLLLLAVRSVPIWGQKPLEGAMIAPVMRSAMWAYLGNAAYADQLWQAVNHDYFTRLNCGGLRTTDSDYEQKCSPCGDAANSNRPNEHGGKYSIGKVVARYRESQYVNVSVDIRSLNPGGTFQFSLCVTDKTTKVSHSCFQQHILRWQNTQITQIPAPQQQGLATYTLKLPTGVICENCVVQWLWRDGSSTCDPPGSSNCGQQTVTNCADVQIFSAGVPFPDGFDHPRYDAYSSIFDPMDTDDHGIGIHVPRSSLDLAITLRPSATTPSSIPSLGGSIPGISLVGGSIPIVNPGGNSFPGTSPDSSIPVITVIPDGTTSANSSTSDDSGEPPETSEKLVEPVGVVLPAVVGTSNVLAGNNGIGIALLLFALYMYLSQQQLTQGDAVFGPSAPPGIFSTPLTYQNYMSPTTSIPQSIVPNAPVFNSGGLPNTQVLNGGTFSFPQSFAANTPIQNIGVLSNTQVLNSGTIQGQPGFGGLPFPFSQNSFFLPGSLNTAITPLPQSGVGGPSMDVFQQPFSNTNTGFTSLQTPFVDGRVPTFNQQPFWGNSLFATPNIPVTTNGFNMASQQILQNNNAFATIPTQRSFVNGISQSGGAFLTQTSLQTPFQSSQDVVFPQFDQEPSTIRRKERMYNGSDELESCECHARIYLLTVYCHKLSTEKCRKYDACFCKQERRLVPATIKQGQRTRSSFNTNQEQKMTSSARGSNFQRRFRAFPSNKQNQ
ncbi:uncharacterized protein LOC132552715 [Ylistrum balloti]|uniref:uncharacterized protein LOC132552715 n=1 Tax=Ylistrum balloti TaxID=509963 RepID=UPI002905D899|nr:uncharacterized protein LOC132552715 [Ylistrum balloti]